MYMGLDNDDQNPYESVWFFYNDDHNPYELISCFDDYDQKIQIIGVSI